MPHDELCRIGVAFYGVKRACYRPVKDSMVEMAVGGLRVFTGLPESRRSLLSREIHEKVEDRPDIFLRELVLELRARLGVLDPEREVQNMVKYIVHQTHEIPGNRLGVFVRFGVRLRVIHNFHGGQAHRLDDLYAFFGTQPLAWFSRTNSAAAMNTALIAVGL